MERIFDTNYILNDVYDNADGTVRTRRFDSNYIWNAIYDPDLPGIRVKDILGLFASSVSIDASEFDGLLNDTITDVQKLADFLDNLTLSQVQSDLTQADNNKPDFIKHKPEFIASLNILTQVATDGTVVLGSGIVTDPIMLSRAGSYTLTAGSWSNKSYTLTYPDMTTTLDVFISPVSKVDSDLYAQNGVFCTSQAAGTLTFSCVTTPTSDINLKIKVL